jgi:hypothetical protein
MLQRVKTEWIDMREVYIETKRENYVVIIM